MPRMTKTENDDSHAAVAAAPAPAPTTMVLAAEAAERVEKAMANGDRVNLADLQRMPMPVLNKMAKQFNIEGIGTLKKHEVIFKILQLKADKCPIIGEGVLEILSDGFGFLRSPFYN